MGLFLDLHTPKYKDRHEVIWDMAVAMNKELLALRDAGCKCIQIEEPTLHFWANTYGKAHEEVKFMVEAYNREVQGLEDVELWIHTCWGNPNMQRVIENDSYRESFQLYLEACRGDVWTIETKDRNLREIELFAPFKGQLSKKIAIGVVSHRTLQVESGGGSRQLPSAMPSRTLRRSSLLSPAIAVSDGRAATGTLRFSRRRPLRRARTSSGASWDCR